jgi:hypothetical protein
LRFPHGKISNMSQTPEPPAAPRKKSLDLIDLLPAKVSVVTSLGTLYMRRARVSDWKHFESDDLAELGRIAVRQLANRIEDKNDDGPLTNDDFDNLDNADFNALAHAIAKLSDWGKLPVGTDLQGLGQAVLAAREQERGRHKKMLEEMRKSISGSYAFLDKSTLEKLQGQVAGLADIRASLSDSEAIKRALGLAGSSYGQMTPDLAGTHVSKEIMRSFERATAPSQVVARATDVFGSMPGKEELEKAMGLTGSSYDRLKSELAGTHVSEEMMRSFGRATVPSEVVARAAVLGGVLDKTALAKVMGLADSLSERVTRDLKGSRIFEEMNGSLGRATSSSEVNARAAVLGGVLDRVALEKAVGLAVSSYDQVTHVRTGDHVSEQALRTIKGTSASINIEIDTPRIHWPASPESTPIGRASIESAENSRLLAQRMDGLVEVVVGLNQTLVTEVLPSWIKQVEHDQRGAKESFEQAANGIRWTKWAVIASIVVTMLATWWQVSVARDIDRENSVQQLKALDMLRAQLVVQQKFADQQAQESEKLRELLESKSQTPVVKK